MDFEYLLFLQNLRAEAPNFINSLLLFISEFAAGSLPVVIIVVFYWCIDKRTGQRMGLCFAGATMVTQLIKNIACVYRPWKQDARLQIAPEAAATATGYSFPSGHATLAASFYGNIAAYLKKYSKWWILPCVLLTLLVVLYWLTHAKEVTPDMTLDLALFFAIFLPFVMPKIHERYFFLADMLSILYAARYRNRRFMPLLVVGASLMSYMPILTRQRPVDERVLGLMMLAALVVVSRDLLRKMRRSRAELKAEGGKAA